MNKTHKIILLIVSIALILTSIGVLTACGFNDEPKQVNLQIDDSITNGKVTADKDAYIEGETVVLTIVRNVGYELVSIKINGEEKISEVSSDGKKLEFVIEEDTVVSAEFAKIETYRLQISVSGGGNVVSDKSVYMSGNTAVLTIAPGAYRRLKSITVDGVEKINEVTTSNGKQTLSFVVTSNVVIVAEFEELPPADLSVNVSSRVNLNGMTLTLTTPDGVEQSVTVVDGHFTVTEAEQGTVYTVTGESRGMHLTLGTILADGDAVEFDPSSALSENSGTLDLVSGTYVVNPEYHKGINLIPVTAITGDAWFVTKIQIAPEDMAALLASDDEIVAGISLKSGDQTSIEHMIQLKPAVNISSIVCGSDAEKGGSGVWDYDANRKQLFFDSNKVLTAEGQALAGSGLYFIVHYDSDSGMTYTYWGTSLENITVLREWGTGTGHAFTAASEITGVSIGYVHTTWGTNPPCKLTVSEVGYGATLVDALQLADVTLKDGNSFEHGTVKVEGKPYGNITLTFIPDADYGVGSVTVNGTPMYPDSDGKIVIEEYKQSIIDVVAVFNNNKFALTKTEGANVTLSIKDKDGNELTAEALSKVQYGTILTIEAILDNGYIIKEGKFTINGVPQQSSKLQYTVVDNTAIAVEAELSATITGVLDAEHYSEYLDSLEIYAQSNGGTAKYVGTLENNKWTVTVPATYTDFKVYVNDATGRFHNVEKSFADTNTSAPSIKLIPVMNKYDIWTNHNGASVPDQSKLVLNADGSYSIIKTESGNALSNSEWWASGVATGATFAGVTSDHFVLETEIILHSAGGWNQWHAGITVDEKEFIMIMDRDWQLAAWTEWNLAEGSAGSWTDLITDEKAAAAGIVKDNSWGTEAKPMKITVVRDGKDMYIFLNEVFIGKFAISTTLFPNSNRDGSSSYVGFMVKSGTEATFKNYWYELGEENVNAYLAGKKTTAPTLNVVDDNGDKVENITVNYYKEVLVSTDNANNYVETTEWQLATEADMYAGAILKAVFIPGKLEDSVIIVNGLKHNGNTVSIADNEYKFTASKTDVLELEVIVSTPIDAEVTVAGGVNLNGVTLTLVNTTDESDVRKVVVENGKIALLSVATGYKYNVYAHVANVKTGLGVIKVSGESISWTPEGTVAAGTNTADVANNTYSIVGADKGRVDFNVLSGSITAGDVFIVTKIQIPEEQLKALISQSGEAVVGVELRAGDRAVENMLWINGGNIKLLSGDWTEVPSFVSGGELVNYGAALAGDGLYFGVQYVASSGMTYTWLGTSLDTLTCIRDWGTGGATDPGYRSFDANSQITGFGLGYVHCWTGNDANLRADVTYSEVFVSKTIDGVKNSNVLLDMEKASLKWQSTSNTFNGTGYHNAQGTLAYDEESGAAKYSFAAIETHDTKPYGKSFVPYIQGFNFTDISAYSTITFKVKIDETTCSENFALMARPFNKTAATPQKIVAGEWVELTFNISDFTHAWDTTVTGYLAAVNKSSLTNLGIVFIVEDTDTMSLQPGFTMYISDFTVQ